MSTTTPHPLDPASAYELTTAANILRAYCATEGVELHFKNAGLHEPPKAQLLPYLRAERSGDQAAQRELRKNLPREIYVMFLYRFTPRLFDAVVDVTHGRVVRCTEQPRHHHAPADRMEMDDMAAICIQNPLVLKELERLGLPASNVVMDTWIYGRDDDSEDRRLVQIFMYQRNPKHPDQADSCHYMFPLDFMVVMDMVERKVLDIHYIPLSVDPTSANNNKDTTTFTTGNPIEPEYAHDLMGIPLRESIKPLYVSQPEGASFQVDGQLIQWEKWRFRVGFNYREGMTIHDVNYDGREVFYRLSMAEMFVPYGSPHSPTHRKAAFDLGDVGAGQTANNLALGCDCLGLIKYFHGHTLLRNGQAQPKPNAICMHEVDAGIQWKHTNHRTGRAVAVRKRQLVLQQLITVSNYEYIFYWIFDQSGEIEFETRATGILSTVPIDPSNNEHCGWATRVADGVAAPVHQHTFSLRIDPMIDGDGNTIQVVDSIPMPFQTEQDKQANPWGLGYVTTSRDIQQSGTEENQPSKARVFKIINPNKINPVSHTPVGYKLIPIVSQGLMADPQSWHGRRCDFAHHPIWVTAYRDQELFPAGQWTNQSRGGEGLRPWVERKDAVANADPVVWHTYTFTHNPRVEDAPIMPVETVRLAIKPVNFFGFNPALDVPPSQQCDNRSVLHESNVGEQQTKDSACCTSKL